MEIINRVKELIGYLNISEREFASSIGVGQRSVNYYLKGEQKPNLDFISKIISSYPEINTEWLITGKGDILKSGSSDIKIFVPEDLPKQVGRLYRAPIYESYPVSAGLHGLSAIREDKADGYAYTSMPGVIFFPVVGCSFEPIISAGQYIGVVKLNSWDRVDTEKIYYILTKDERMLKRLRIDDNDKSILWCVSPNFNEFKILKEDILEISHVFFYGKML